MAEREWTPDQKNAIEARGGTLLVSAAAGSGKTAVLVERVVQRLLDPINGCDADRLLVVTFTKAAAAEMRERISAALSARLAARPDDARLLRQQMLLPCAAICTIDSFCNDLVRENFHRLDLAPDYKILDAGELTLLRSEAMDIAMDILVCLSNRYVGLYFFRRCTCISAYDVFCDSHLYDHGFDLPVLSNLPKFAARSICTQ